MNKKNSEQYLRQMKPEENISRNHDDEQYRQALADAVHHAVTLLQEEGLISRCVSNVISPASTEIGREICRRVKDIAEDMELVEDEEVMHHMDSDLEDDFEEVILDPTEHFEEESATRSSSSSSESEHSSEDSKNSHRVSWETKVKVVNMMKLHPRWSFHTIRSKSTRLLTDRDQLLRWKHAVEKRGPNYDKNYIINDWTYKRFLGARSRKRLVTTKMLQQWAMEKAQELMADDFRFEASKNWVDKFKRDRNIRHRRIIRFVNKSDPPMLEVMLP